MKMYLAGPMSGYADHNFPAFDAAAEHLHAEGHEVFSPADVARAHPTMSYRGYMRIDIDTVFSVNAVFMLRGWELSKGARAEHALAVCLGLTIYYEGPSA